MSSTQLSIAIFVASIVAITIDRTLTFVTERVKVARQKRKDEREAAERRAIGLKAEMDKLEGYRRGFVDFFQKKSALNPFSPNYNLSKHCAYENGRADAAKAAAVVSEEAIKRVAESKQVEP